MFFRRSKIILIVLTISLSNYVSAQENRRTYSRKDLNRLIRSCPDYEFVTDDCDDAISQAIELFKRGDRQFLGPLLDMGIKRDTMGVFAESLGCFYGEILLGKNTRLFLAELLKRPQKEQRQLTEMAALMDGGGMSPKMLNEVRKELREISKQTDDPLAEAAKLCLQRVEAANKRIRQYEK
jgi:hypothetical protein